MQGLFKTFVGCDCHRESTTLRFEKHFYLTRSKVVFRGCKQTKFPFFINCVLKSHPCPKRLEEVLMRMYLLHVVLFSLESKISIQHCTKNEIFHYGFFSKCDQIRRNLRIWSQLLKKSLLENLIFYAVQ